MDKGKIEDNEANLVTQRQLRSQKPTNNTEAPGRGKSKDMPKGKVNTTTGDKDLNPQDAGKNPPEMGKEITTDKLLKYLKESQEKSEKNLMKAIENSKKEINENMQSMVATLTESVCNIRADLTKVEQSFDTKIRNIQDNLEVVNRDLKGTADRISSINQTSKNDKDKILSRIKVTEGDLADVQKKQKTENEALRKELWNFISEQNERMAHYESEIAGIRNYTSENVDEIKLATSGNSNELKVLTNKVEILDNKMRQTNLVVEGLPEDTEKSDKDVMTSYIQKVLPDFTAKNIISLYRIGKPKKKVNNGQDWKKTRATAPPGMSKKEEDELLGNKHDDDQLPSPSDESNLVNTPVVKHKPRTTLIGFATPELRDLVLARASDIKANAGLDHFWINRDQNDNSRRKHQMVKACYKLMLDRKYACSMRGSIISFQGKQYDYDRLSLLPESCTPFYVKTRETTDKEGLCFSSEYVFCSNLAPAKLKYEGVVYHSVEHAFQCTKVKDAGYTELADEIRGIRNPYDVKRLGQSIQIKKSWKKKARGIMDDLIQLKFDQNPKLKEKLMEVPYKKFYEMTTDKVWATGRKINKTDQEFSLESLTGGKNFVGKAIGRVKNGYIIEEVRLGLRKPESSAANEDDEGSEQLSESGDSASSDTEVETVESPGTGK